MKNLKRYSDYCPRWDQYYESVIEQSTIRKGFKINNGKFEEFWKDCSKSQWAVKLRRIWRIKKLGYKK